VGRLVPTPPDAKTLSTNANVAKDLHIVAYLELAAPIAISLSRTRAVGLNFATCLDHITSPPSRRTNWIVERRKNVIWGVSARRK